MKTSYLNFFYQNLQNGHQAKYRGQNISEECFHTVTILYQAIENTVANTTNATCYTRGA